jgi:hypothetical protein
MKNAIMSFSLLCGVCLTACNGDNSSTSNSSDSITTTSNMDTSMTGSAKDSMNINNSESAMIDQNTMDLADKAATGGMMEVELGNMAQ